MFWASKLPFIGTIVCVKACIVQAKNYSSSSPEFSENLVKEFYRKTDDHFLRRTSRTNKLWSAEIILYKHSWFLFSFGLVGVGNRWAICGCYIQLLAQQDHIFVYFSDFLHQSIWTSRFLKNRFHDDHVITDVGPNC